MNDIEVMAYIIKYPNAHYIFSPSFSRLTIVSWNHTGPIVVRIPEEFRTPEIELAIKLR